MAQTNSAPLIGKTLACPRAAVTALLVGVIVAACTGKPDVPLLVSKACWIDTINGKVENLVQVEPGPLHISGWAADSTNGSATDKLVIQVPGAKGNLFLAQAAQQRSERMDVANVLGQPGYKGAGFNVVMAGSTLDPGEYGLSAAIYRPDAAAICASLKRIIVK